MSLRSCLLTAALLAATSASATEVKTYQGTIGKIPVILELTDPLDNGTREGRYSYVSKGIDIPLHGKAKGKGAIALEVEAPCTVKLCGGDEDTGKPAPVGADWGLKESGKMLTGSWTDRKSGKKLPVSLDYVGTRTLQGDISPDTPLVVDYLPDGESARDYPYDYLKLKGPYRKGAVQDFNGSTFRIDEDERIGVGYPAIEKLSSGSADAANAWLLDQRISMVLRDYACMAKAYKGFGWMEYHSETTGEYRSEQSGTLEYLSDRLVGLTEAGSFFCGGAHPDNSTYYKLGDVRTGTSITPESLLKGFTFMDYDGNPMQPSDVTDEKPGHYVPSPELIATVKKERQPDESEAESGCEMDTLIDQYLSVAFKGHNLVFVLRDVPHYATACAVDLYAVPLEKARDYLTEEGQAYFVELDK